VLRSVVLRAKPEGSRLTVILSEAKNPAEKGDIRGSMSCLSPRRDPSLALRMTTSRRDPSPSAQDDTPLVILRAKPEGSRTHRDSFLRIVYAFLPTGSFAPFGRSG